MTMSNISREDVERIFRQKLAELNHMEITLKQEFTLIVDACLKYFIDRKIVPAPYSRAFQLIDRVCKGTVRSGIISTVGSAFSLGITYNTVKATHAAMEKVLQWLEETNEQDADKIGYIIDQYIRYYDYFFREDYVLEDPSLLKEFEPDLQFRKYKK